jgi:hypothetical protein
VHGILENVAMEIACTMQNTLHLMRKEMKLKDLRDVKGTWNALFPSANIFPQYVLESEGV